MQSAPSSGLAEAGQPAGLTDPRRKLVFKDATTLLVLAAITIALFGITLALFRSFQAHRDDLGKTWTSQARAALARHDPAAAVPDLRAALSYAPEDRANQLLLAEALAGSGHEIEAASYFLNLWTTRPGDGFVNLQLARLARRRGDATQATEYYRAAIFGDWGNQGQVRRRECRMELAAYLIERGELGAARDELVIVTSNAPANAQVLLQIGEQLAAAGDFAAALNTFTRALTVEPGDQDALVHAEAAAMANGSYGKVEDLFTRARRQTTAASRTVLAEATLLAHDAARLTELSLSRELPEATRSRHLLAASAIAQTRLRSCAGLQPSANPQLAGLSSQWKGSRDLRRRATAGNADAQDGLADLIFETERVTESATQGASANAQAGASNTPACGAPSGDDLRLLVLAPAEGRANLPSAEVVKAYQAHLVAVATGAWESSAHSAPAAAEAQPR